MAGPATAAEEILAFYVKVGGAMRRSTTYWAEFIAWVLFLLRDDQDIL